MKIRIVVMIWKRCWIMINGIERIVWNLLNVLYMSKIEKKTQEARFSPKKTI